MWSDPLTAREAISVNNIFSNRTRALSGTTTRSGSLLFVIAGEGHIQVEGEAALRLMVGDVAWIPEGKGHWHGAAPDSYILHIAISIGETIWCDEVSDAHYHKAGAL
jgi:gentisate 1,2-dioxygenase